MRKLASFISLATLGYLMTVLPAFAYIGPGLGAGAVGALLGVIGAIALALFAVIYYPIKRALRGRKGATAPASEETRSE